MFTMRKSVPFVLTSFTSLAIGVAAGFWAAGRRVDDQIVSSYASERLHYTKGMYSIGSVEEIVSDENGDGLIDDWSIHITHPDYSTAMYHIVDLDFDETPDRISLSMDDGRSYIALIDHDRDGTMDWWGVSLQSPTHVGVAFKYIDLNLDGKLDIMERYTNNKADEFYIQKENTWTRAGRTDGDPREIAKIRIDGEPVDVKFEDGEWELVEPM